MTAMYRIQYGVREQKYSVIEIFMRDDGGLHYDSWSKKEKGDLTDFDLEEE